MKNISRAEAAEALACTEEDLEDLSQEALSQLVEKVLSAPKVEERAAGLLPEGDLELEALLAEGLVQLEDREGNVVDSVVLEVRAIQEQLEHEQRLIKSNKQKELERKGKVPWKLPLPFNESGVHQQHEFRNLPGLRGGQVYKVGSMVTKTSCIANSQRLREHGTAESNIEKRLDLGMQGVVDFANLCAAYGLEAVLDSLENNAGHPEVLKHRLAEKWLPAAEKTKHPLEGIDQLDLYLEGFATELKVLRDVDIKEGNLIWLCSYNSYQEHLREGCIKRDYHILWCRGTAADIVDLHFSSQRKVTSLTPLVFNYRNIDKHHKVLSHYDSTRGYKEKGIFMSLNKSIGWLQFVAWLKRNQNNDEW